MKENTSSNQNSRKMIGTVVSDKMDKTRLIEIIRKKSHPIYQKTYFATSKIKAHDEKNEYAIGDQVEIVMTRPKSRDKAWAIARKIK